MALTNAERQARHREQMKERLAELAPPAEVSGPLRNDAETSAEAFLEMIRGKFEHGMIELLQHGDRASDPLGAICEPRQAAVDRFNTLGREGQWRLLLDGLRNAGQAAALRIVEECHREWDKEHPRAPREPVEVVEVVPKGRRGRRRSA